MTLAASPRYHKHSPVVLTDTFAVPFPIFATADLRVFVDGVENVSFSVTATFAEGRSSNAVVTLTASVVDVDVEIYGSREPRRDSQYLSSSPNLAQNLQFDADVLTAGQQELSRDLARTLKVPVGLGDQDEITGLTDGATIVFDAVAQQMKAGPTSTDIAAAQSAAVSAIAAKDDAEAAAALAESITLDLFGQHRGDWLNGVNYLRGDLVAYNGSTYISQVNHTALTGYSTPETGTNWTEFWIIFASKGAAGAGTGDVLAANAGSEFVSVAGAFRNNVSAMLRAITPRTNLNFATDTTLDSTIYNVGTGNTQIPNGGVSGDSLVSAKIDADDYNYLWFGGTRAWIGRRLANVNTWVELATKADVTAVLAVAQFSSRKTSGTNGNSFPTGSAAALEITNTDRIALGVTVASNRLTFANAGTYLVEAFVPMANVSGAARAAQILLHNITTATEIARGQSTQTGAGVVQTLVVSAVVTVAAGNQVELRGIANGSNVLNGRAASLGQEIYNIVRVRAL